MKKNFVIWSDINVNEEDYREAFNEYISEFEDDDAVALPTFDEFVSESVSDNLSYFLEEIRCYETCHYNNYIVLADLGRWNGRFDGGKVIKGLENAIKQCLEYHDFCEISYTDGCLTVQGIHHDGTDWFKIKQLTPRGERYKEYYESELSDRELCNKLFTDRHLSKHPEYFKNNW